MVLGLRSKHRKGETVQVDYLVHLQGIRPWPPLLSSPTIQSVLLKWENGNRNSGFLNASFEDSKFECKESFTLPLTFSREKKALDKFQKNLLEFSLYESRKDKTNKGQLLGTAVINLAEYGILGEMLSISTPLTLKKSSKKTEQPVLFLKLQPIDKNSSSSSPTVNLSKQVSLENYGEESVSALVNESNDEGMEIASFTDDNVSSHLSQTIASSSFLASGASPSRSEKDQLESAKLNASIENGEPAVPMALEAAMPAITPSISSFRNSVSLKNFSSQASCPNLVNPSNDCINLLKFSHSSTISSHNTLGELRNRMNSVHPSVEELGKKNSEDSFKKQGTLRSGTISYLRKPLEFESNPITNGKLKHAKSVQLSHNSVEQNGFSEDGLIMKKSKEISHQGDSLDNLRRDIEDETKEMAHGFLVRKSEKASRIEMLQEELMEAAAVEVGLYSVVAEHGSSKTKVHAPARRISRFYLQTCKAKNQASSASAARAAISGLVLISKACGNDVPRLTFWLSNSITLRAILNQAVADGQRNLPQKWNDPSSICKQKSNLREEQDEWEDPKTFIIALEKIEEWIFSRIVESIWWQTLTPHMQSATAKTKISGSRKTNGKNYLCGVQEQGSFSAELWRKAFKDSCERLCPIRGGGHKCGCLPFLAKLVMEQLVARLDVAMFNAILRESDEEMPTDPVSDPISDPNVLPIPAGKASFGAGAQLKNAIGSWSRWLTDLFDIEDNESAGDDKCPESNAPFKPFRLLNALSDLMMLPFQMLADSSTRKEVCPLFGPPVIKRVLNNFVPDEFCPEPIPEAILASLDSQDAEEFNDGESLASVPCIANSPIYSPPRRALLLTSIVGDIGSQTSVTRKSYTSDDELDALDSPLTSIFGDGLRSSSSVKTPTWIDMRKRGRNVSRYQLLRQVWRDGVEEELKDRILNK